MRSVGMSTGAVVMRRAWVIAALAIVVASCGTGTETASSPRRVPAVDHSASATPATSPAPKAARPLDRIIGHPVTADVDGDGRPDHAVLRLSGHKWGGLQDALLVSLGRGPQLRLGMPDDGSV